MFKNLQIFFIIIQIQLLLINCFPLCNKETNVPPNSEYHCSGLIIDNITNTNDKYCCLWTFTDISSNKEIKRCSSINEEQFENLNEYINNKREKYNDLNIKCVKNQNIYCSNIVLDEEQTSDCNKLLISNSKDKYCCRWTFEDSENYQKKNDYCASINQFEYLNIKQYIKYKNEDPEQRYENLQIDCKATFIKNLIIFCFLYMIISLIL